MVRKNVFFFFNGKGIDSQLVWMSYLEHGVAGLFQKFGFTGKSTFFIKLRKIISKAFYIVSATMGSIMMALGGAYAGSYNFRIEWVEVSGK